MVVVELKRDRTPRDVVAQALEYAAFAARLEVDALEGILGEYHPDETLGLAEHHCEYFGFDHTEAVAFNKDQRIVIIGQSVTREIRQTAMFLGSKGIRVTCVEFTFFRDADGGRLLSQEIVVGREHAKPRQTEVYWKLRILRISLAGVMGSVAAFPLPAPAGGDSRLVVWVFGVTQAGAPYRRFEYGESVRLGWAAG